MADIQSGAAKLFGALTGGGGIYEAARAKQQLANIGLAQQESDLMKKIDEAKMVRDQRVAREGYERDFAALFPDRAALAPNLANLAIGTNANFAQIGQGVDNIFKANLRPQIADAYVAEGVNRGSALAAALGGTALKINDIDAGYQLNPYTTGGAVAPTSLTQASIADKAMRGQVYADTTRAKAEAYVDRQYRPPGSGSQAKPPAYTVPSGKRLADALGDDKASQNAFLSWQAQQAEADPRYNDGDFALAQWKRGKPATRQMRVGSADVMVPADVSQDAMMALLDANRQRGERGLAPMSRDEQVRFVDSFNRTGTASDTGAQRGIRLYDGLTETFIPLKQDEGQVVKGGPVHVKSAKDRERGNAGSPIEPTKPSGKRAPPVGTVRGGYRYTGGDPSKPSSWTRV